MKKKLTIALSILLGSLVFTGCMRESERVSYNLSKEADNFNVVRQLTVIDCITGDTMFQMTGRCSIEHNAEKNQLEIIVEDTKGYYQKHIVGLSDNVTYVVEQLDVKNVSEYQYTLNYNPKMWIPVDVKNID